MLDIVLASASPRRYEILKRRKYNIDVIPSNYDEQINGLQYSDELVKNCAYQKALEVKNRVGDETLIVSADTVVVNDGVILGKPKDKDEAFKMLRDLSNKTHFVATAVCLMYKGKEITGVDKTFVVFRELSDSDILRYIKDKNPLDKAGSYGIQDKDFDFAIKLDGNLDNVIGFPMNLFVNMLSICINDKPHYL